MKITIPTLTEVYPELLQDQIMKQQTSLLTAILDLHKTLQGFQPNSDQLTQENRDQQKYINTLELEIKRLRSNPDNLEIENQKLQQEVIGLEREIEALNRELDAVEGQEKTTTELQREVEFHVNRFNTLQEHYKNSTSYNQELLQKIKAMEVQMATINLSAPKGYKSWEEAATTERLHHNQTKTELANKLEEVATLKLKLDRFQKLFREALGQ